MGNNAAVVSKPKKRKHGFDFWVIVSLIIIIICLIFIVYPFLTLIIESFQKVDDGVRVFTFENYLKFFTKKYYTDALLHSLLISTVVTILATLLGVPLAYLGARFNLYGKPVIKIMIVLSMLSPPFIGAYTWITLLGRNGFVTQWLNSIGVQFGSIYGLGGILLVFTLKLYPMVYMYVSGALTTIDHSLEEASENLGISGFRRIMKVTLPVISPTIFSAMLMVFMTSLADFGTPALIGQGYTTLPVVIYNEFLNEVGTDTGFASALSVMIVLIALAVLIVQKRVVDRRSYNMTSLRPPKPIELAWPKKLLATLAVFIVSFLSVLPQIMVTIQSFVATNRSKFLWGQWSLDSYNAVWKKLANSIGNTFLYAGIAMVITIVISLLGSYLIVRRKSARSDFIDLMLMFPYVIPGAVLGICLISAFNEGIFKSGFMVLTGTMWIVIIGLIIRKLPYTMRSSVGILYQIDKSVEEASISLGYSQAATFFKTTVPLMLPGVISGGILSFVTMINTLSATLITYTGKTITMSVAIYNQLTNDAFGQASALATLLTLATVLSLVVFNIVTKGKGSFV